MQESGRSRWEGGRGTYILDTYKQFSPHSLLILLRRSQSSVKGKPHALGCSPLFVVIREARGPKIERRAKVRDILVRRTLMQEYISAICSVWRGLIKGKDGETLVPPRHAVFKYIGALLILPRRFHVLCRRAEQG